MAEELVGKRVKLLRNINTVGNFHFKKEHEFTIIRFHVDDFEYDLEDDCGRFLEYVTIHDFRIVD